MKQHGAAMFASLTGNRIVTSAGQAEWGDCRACWWDNDPASMAFGPVPRVLVAG